jgi:hypothetical protein
MADKELKEYQALTHVSAGRERVVGEPFGFGSADLVPPGEKVMITEEKAQPMLERGSIRPWADKDKDFPRVTARDLSGKRFPGQPAFNPALAGTSAEPRQRVSSRQARRAPSVPSSSISASAEPVAPEGSDALVGLPEGSEPTPLDPENVMGNQPKTGNGDPYAK